VLKLDTNTKLRWLVRFKEFDTALILAITLAISLGLVHGWPFLAGLLVALADLVFVHHLERRVRLTAGLIEGSARLREVFVQRLEVAALRMAGLEAPPAVIASPGPQVVVLSRIASMERGAWGEVFHCFRHGHLVPLNEARRCPECGGDDSGSLFREPLAEPEWAEAALRADGRAAEPPLPPDTVAALRADYKRKAGGPIQVIPLEPAAGPGQVPPELVVMATTVLRHCATQSRPAGELCQMIRAALKELEPYGGARAVHLRDKLIAAYAPAEQRGWYRYIPLPGGARPVPPEAVEHRRDGAGRDWLRDGEDRWWMRPTPYTMWYPAGNPQPCAHPALTELGSIGRRPGTGPWLCLDCQTILSGPHWAGRAQVGVEAIIPLRPVQALRYGGPDAVGTAPGE
jgi:hypothetical protein